ncbi:MAG TPA: helix-turn-helix domain-containing protein [Allocoleopsis sp.]
MEIIVNLKSIRQQKGLSQNQLARALEMSLTNLRLIETKQAKSIPFDTLKKLCTVLDCEPGDLLKLEK